MREVLRLLWPHTAGRRLVVLGGVAGTVLVTAAQLARPFPLKLVVDALAGEPTSVDVRLVAVVGLLVVLIALADAAGTYASETWMRLTGEHIVHELRVAVYGHLQRMSLRYHTARPTGDLVTRITGDANAVGELVSESVVKVLGAILLLVGMVAVSLSLDPVLTLVAAAVTPLLAVASITARRRIKVQARQQRRAEGEIAALTTESLAAIATVKVLGTEEEEADRLRGESSRRRDAGVRGSVVEGRFGGLVDVLEAVGTAAVLVVGVIRVTAGALTPGDLVVMASYVRRFYRPLRDLSRQAGRISRSMARAERIAEVLSADDALPERPGAHAGGRAAGALDVRGVSFAHEGREPVLRDVSFSVPAGTTVAVVGASGAGKSTLASLLARVDDPTSGAVLLDGRDLRDCALPWVRRQVGFVLQSTDLFRGTVSENLRHGVDADHDAVVAAARAAGAHEFISALPDGYATVLGPDGAGLSGGQRQRLAIARALLRDPAVVVLDEPTSGLDADSEASVVRALETLLRGRTTVLITHAIRLATRADRVLVLHDGRVVQDDAPARLLARPGRFRDLAAAQGLVGADPIPAPRDERLPQLARVLDPVGVAELLASQGRPVDSVRIRYVRYKPGTNVVVDCEVSGVGLPDRVVLMAAADRDLGRRARRAHADGLAARAAERTGGLDPVVHHDEVGVLVQWLPADLWLPALATSPAELCRAAGLPPGPGVDLVAYKPRRRAVLRVGGHVLKLYADEASFRHAAAGVLAAPRLPVPSARPAGLVTELRMTAQHLVEGDPLQDPVAAAPEVGQLLRRLHRTDPAGAASWPLDPLAGAIASAETVRALVPMLSDRLDALVRRLRAEAPTTSTPRWSHGDMHSGQVLRTASGLVLLDLDEHGVGDPAQDLATYAAHVHDGMGAGDLVHDAVEGLVEGYGERPASLGWHLAVALLRRSMSPFRSHPTADWPDRVEAMLKAAEEAW